MHENPHLQPQEDPLVLFERWFDEAVDGDVSMPASVALATVDPDGRPAARMVLYKGMSGGGLRFFTNYTSRKARHLEANGRAAMVFHWLALERQVRVEGTVELLSAEESDAYFGG